MLLLSMSKCAPEMKHIWKCKMFQLDSCTPALEIHVQGRTSKTRGSEQRPKRYKQ